MKSIEENEFLSNFCKENNIELPKNLQNRKIYEEIGSFKDAEYIYCIAYEMLIRTDEYNELLKEYEPLKNKSKYDMTNDEFEKLRKLIEKMNDLGLKKTSFLGFDCNDDSDHVFKRIEYYNEVINSNFNVRMLHKLELNSDENIFYLLAKFYVERGKLYSSENSFVSKSPINVNEQFIDFIKNKSQWKNQEQYNEFCETFEKYYIPCVEKETKKIKYKSLCDNTIYLNELDEDFLSQLKEKRNDDLLIPVKSDFSFSNTEFWYKYFIDDIKDGLNKLIEYHLDKNLIYNQDGKHIQVSKNDILKNSSNFYIPCVNRLLEPKILKSDKATNPILDDNFVKQLKLNGNVCIVKNEGTITLKKEENFYLVQISKNISLRTLSYLFLETLTYEDLKNIYIETEPIFNRPRLMFDEARLTNVPINLNLSKEDLLLYVSKIKDNYDRDKNIVKTDEEYFFDLRLERNSVEMPQNIKHANKKRKSSDKRILPVKRHAFTKDFAYAFYIYDLFKFFIPFFERKIKDIKSKRDSKIKKIKDNAKKRDITINQVEIDEANEIAKMEIKNYENNNLITKISDLLHESLRKHKQEEQEEIQDKVKYYLTTMKEFIHGVNQKGESNVFKKKYNPNKKENPNPKYKNLIIGDSYIIKSNKSDLSKILLG